MIPMARRGNPNAAEDGKKGGRPKGSRNKRTIAQQKAIAESGLSPLDFLISIMRNEEEDLYRRMEAAKSAAPYVHPKLANINHGGQDNNPIKTKMEIVIVEPDGTRTSI